MRAAQRARTGNQRGPAVHALVILLGRSFCPELINQSDEAFSVVWWIVAVISVPTNPKMPQCRERRRHSLRRESRNEPPPNDNLSSWCLRNICNLVPAQESRTAKQADKVNAAV